MGRDGLSVIQKATQILEVFLNAGAESLSFSEIAAGGGMSPATTHRVLSDMTRWGLVSQHAQRDEYRLGPIMRSAGVLAAARSNLRSIAAPHVEQLRDECRETVIVAELHGGMVVPVLRADGLHELRMNQQVGKRYPAYAGGTGKVLLAHLDDDALTDYLDSIEPEALTAATTTDRDELRAELDEVRRIGVAVSRGERVPDAIAVSAPLFEAPNQLGGALTISGPASRFDEAGLPAAAVLVKDHAERISAALGQRPREGVPTARELGDPATPEHSLLREMCARAWRRGREHETAV